MNLSHHDGIYHFPSLQGFTGKIFSQYFVIYKNLHSPVLRKSYFTPTYQWLLQSLFLSMMVLLLFISPQYGSFTHLPPQRYLFLCHISPRPPQQRASHEPVSFNKEKMQGFQRGNYKQGTSQRKKSSLSSNDDLLSLTTGSSSMDFSYI